MSELVLPVPFKRCTCCPRVWESRAAFLEDAQIQNVGYMAHFEDLRLGLFLLNHEPCGTTLAIKAGLFTDLYDGPIFAEQKRGTEECPGYCLNQSKLGPCPARCECAYVRDVLQIVRNFPKSSVPAGVE